MTSPPREPEPERSARRPEPTGRLRGLAQTPERVQLIGGAADGHSVSVPRHAVHHVEHWFGRELSYVRTGRGRFVEQDAFGRGLT